MLFLTSELANKAKIAILSARDTTRAWVPGRGIMGRNVGYIRTGIIRGCHLGFRTNRVLFVSFCLIFSLFSSFFFRYHASSLVGSAVLILFL